MEQYRQVLNDLDDILRAKQEAYGDSFSETFAEFGLVSAVTRITDKTNRLKNLWKAYELNDESVRDTLLDLAGYAILTLAEMQNHTLVS